MYPKFLCIGAQKSGTSWLQANMQDHPQIWLPPVKEVHFLDQKTASPFKALFSDAKRARKGRAYLMEQLRAIGRGGRASDLRWALHYTFAPRTDAWYKALFPEIPGRIPGEICPGYARLRGAKVERVYRLMPDTKIIYLIRNPIDRSWSYASQYFTSPRAKGRGGPTQIPREELLDFLARDREGHSDYIGALEAWQRHYGDGKMLVGFFDELVSDSRSLLKRILDFVGADSGDHLLPPSVAVNRDRGRGPAIPADIQADLARIHLDQLRALHARLNNAWTAKWLASADAAIGGKPDLA